MLLTVRAAACFTEQATAFLLNELQHAPYRASRSLFIERAAACSLYSKLQLALRNELQHALLNKPQLVLRNKLQRALQSEPQLVLQNELQPVLRKTGYIMLGAFVTKYRHQSKRHDSTPRHACPKSNYFFEAIENMTVFWALSIKALTV